MERLYRSHALEKIRRGFVQEIFEYKKIDSPVGPLLLVASQKALHGLLWGDQPGDLGRDFKNAVMAKNNRILLKAERQLKEYFLGARKTFDLPLAPHGTDFQMKAWTELRKIPYGKCITYGEQARRLGNPKAVRAVGGANGKNPICIIVPCHRVIGASGHLTGFGGGMDVKRQLLELEGAQRHFCLK